MRKNFIRLSSIMPEVVFDTTRQSQEEPTMKNNETFSDFIITFLVITALITILEGILGCLFLPEVRFGF